jgi:hypothetical protein
MGHQYPQTAAFDNARWFEFPVIHDDEPFHINALRAFLAYAIVSP